MTREPDAASRRCRWCVGGTGWQHGTKWDGHTRHDGGLFPVSHTELLLPGASDDAQKTRERRSSQSARNGMWLSFFSCFFFLFLLFLIFFFLIYRYFFFFAKIPKAGQTHRKQATSTVTKHSSAVKTLSSRRADVSVPARSFL